ncbi:MAG: dihydropteridine reductase [Lachnospiraceae bacterium]|nr:dihydropteridine reductase [Lachnospiraceae bacterium]
MNRNDQEFLVQKIRTQYTEKENTQLDELKALDKKVKKPANVFAYTFGTIGALVLGSGMSLAMNVIEPGTYYGITIGENMMLPGIIIGLAGIAMVSVNYPIYKGILNSRRNKYADKIIALSDQIMEDKNKQ